MSLCHNLLLPRRGFAVALGLGVVSLAVIAEPIRFSKPTVPIAEPVREQKGLPEARTRGFDFSSPNMDQPMSPVPQPAMRVNPREERERDKDERPWLLRDPKIFSDPTEKGTDKTEANPFESERTKSPWSRVKENNSASRFETPRSLSPVTEFGWDPRNPSGQKNPFGEPSAFASVNEGRTRSPFATIEEPSVNNTFDPGRPNSMFDMFGTRVKEKEKLTPGQVTRAAEFQQMINPSASPSGKGPSALEPVVAVTDAAYRPAPLAIPTIGGLPRDGSKLDPRIADPMTVFNHQNAQLRGPVFDEFDKKSSAQPNRPGASSIESRFQTPLNRQPSVHEFPKRKF
ncbi:MAG TPA: hypothetical protein VK846_10355 [Candidatus Limnocylindria bacterium]|nr:hypothetical protein [Candidatus Limnocylindria bacterium]